MPFSHAASPSASAKDSGDQTTSKSLTRWRIRENLQQTRLAGRVIGSDVSLLSVIKQAVSSSPGRLAALGVALILLTVLVSSYASNSLNTRSEALDRVLRGSEPLSNSSQVLYSSLSIADASANSAFISGGIEPGPLRQRYLDSIATAGKAIVTATQGLATDPEDQSHLRQDLTLISIQLPIYTGLVETARSNNRIGNPVGASYLGEASTLMQTTILPAAERLYKNQADNVSKERSAYQRPPWLTITVLVFLLLVLIAGHQYLARRSRRMVNRGVAVACVCTVIALLWVVVAGLLSVAQANSAERNGATPLHALTNARIDAQKARSAETLALVRRADSDDLLAGYQTSIDQMTQQLESINRADPRVQQHVDEAKDLISGWVSAHQRVLTQKQIGDYDGATAIAIGSGSNSANTLYLSTDREVMMGIDEARTNFRDRINTARYVINFTSPGLLVLGFISASAIAIGFYPRIREYR